MSLKKITLVVCGVLFSYGAIHSQDSTKTIIAENGDGIIKVLRNHGMNVTKYYGRFLELNKGNIRKGSELHVGRTYYLPDAPDSFEQMGRKIQLLNKVETAIFSKELHGIRKKDNSLENTVYYMILDVYNSSKSNIVSNEIAKHMAKELLTHGAKVFMIENAMDKNANLGEYTSAINRLFLKHNGKYQRLLVMNLNDAISDNETKITIAHYDKSKEGQKLASNIGQIFQEMNVLKKTSKEYINVFTHDTNLYLAKNILPVMTYIKIEGGASLIKKQQSRDKANISFADLIAKGILQDYTNLNLEDED